MSNLLFLSNNTFNAPIVVPDLQLWLDASDASTIGDTGGLVDTWADKSTNGFIATGTTTSRPTTGINTSNGKNLISFDGVNDALSIAAASGIDNIWDGGGTIFIVNRPNDTGRLIDKSGASNLGWKLYGTGASGGEQQALFQHDAATGSYGTITDAREITQGEVYVQFVTYNKTTPSTLANIYLNSTTPSATSSIGSGSGAAIDDSTQALVIGNRSDLARPLDGDVGEIIMYDRTLTAGEIALINAYLMNKWGV